MKTPWFTLLAGLILSALAPVVTLFYRGGWFNTPDDPTSPRGMGEPFMRKLHAHLPSWVADYWWLGWRNRAYGFAYATKPDLFKGLHYIHIGLGEISNVVRWKGPFLVRTIAILGYAERTYSLWVKGKPIFCVIVGYRMRPILDEVLRNSGTVRRMWDVPFRPVNMDARPILSFRFGYDD